MTEHFDPATVARYLAGDLDVAEARAVEAHLATCRSCEEALRVAIETATVPAPSTAVLWRAERFGRAESGEVEVEEPQNAEQRETVRDFLGDLGRTLALRGEREVERLLNLSEHERRRAIRAESERPVEMTEDVAARLLARCRRAWTGDLGDLYEAVEAAKLALLVAQSLIPAAGGAGHLGDLRSLALEHLAAANRIARRAGEIQAEILRRRIGSAPSKVQALAQDDAYPMGGLALDPLSEVAEDALAVEIEAALDDLRDASLARGRSREAALAVLDRARLALERGGPAALTDLALAERARFAAFSSPPTPRDAVRYLAAEAERGAADHALIDRLVRVVLDADGGFGEPLGG